MMAVEVAAARRPAAGRGQGAQQERSGERKYTFTFCLERVEKGPYKVGTVSRQHTARMRVCCTYSPHAAGFGSRRVGWVPQEGADAVGICILCYAAPTARL